MPLIIVTGHPSSGKSTVVDRLAKKFEEKGKDYLIIRDEDYGGFDRKNYEFSNKEKDLRSWIRSQVQQNLTKNKVIICDALNYIKGYRYELFLAAKMSKTTYCVVECSPPVATCHWLNEQKPEVERYPKEIIDQLMMRYERPDTKLRWEKPLFEVKIGTAEKATPVDFDEDMAIDLEHPAPRFASIFEDEIVEWICNGTELTENQSTQTVPLAPTNFLHELDRSTQDVVTVLLNAQRTAVRGQNLTIPGATDGANTIKFMKLRTLPELNRLRHQFVNMSKKDPTTDKEKIITGFVDFLNCNLR
ncbi:Protein KTI12 homolog [Caenorhabditis elegans]|uniref:Protein KTI12 homolog n=1 Tax=Caenorhabditis elegans TaxID=6239 RepID=Q7YTI4_CAEEL|nr:Chromatin associated protein KTI12 [Caenorhabditis elegans]CAE18026.1 Chromatin associated protein KTI12 [Caenorhabditis elegans]|eukprot:NP_001023527.1 Uncharacterized protein CELE_Y57G11C.43 [Caenorhabditis elegans]